MTKHQHVWSKLMAGNIMSAEAWNGRMGRTAVCVTCKATLHGYEAAQAIRKRREQVSA